MDNRPLEITIKSRDYWFKIVAFLQQNWALVDPTENGVTVWFVDDASGVFDTMALGSRETAESALLRNGFARYDESPDVREMFAPPPPPFRQSRHPNGAIYSDGRFRV